MFLYIMQTELYEHLPTIIDIEENETKIIYQQEKENETKENRIVPQI